MTVEMLPRIVRFANHTGQSEQAQESLSPKLLFDVIAGEMLDNFKRFTVALV